MMITPELYFDDGLAQLWHGDSRNMSFLKDQSVSMICTSPPYYNQRVYTDLEPLVWGGVDHDHHWESGTFRRRTGDGGEARKQTTNPGANERDIPIHHAWCECGAWRGNLGNEPNMTLYIDHLLEIFRECYRVLRDDGAMWINMGASFGHGNRVLRLPSKSLKQQSNPGANISQHNSGRGGDLLMAPYFLALALQVDGWLFRSDCIWLKSTVMPTSIHGWRWTESGLSKGSWRSTPNHEYIFQFAKSMGHYGDGEAVNLAMSDSYKKQLSDDEPVSGVNRRTVWRDIKREQYGSHTASFPVGLPRICILATTPPSVCSECRAPWARVTGTDDFRPTCCCEAMAAPALVMDCFGGVGTTSVAASALGRASVGVDWSHDFLRQAAIRIAGGIVAK